VGKPGTEGRTLREIARHAINNTRFYPDWGRARITAMIDNRPDWTLSRQRNWGTPLPFFLHRETDELHPDTEKLIERAADIVSKGGIEAWFAASCEDFGVDPAQYRKINDTVDVWFDSGTTHFTVLRHLADHKWPADLYLEGSDQHRGWFQSSLLTGCAMDGRAPYNALLTHGFTVDAQGRKMSKSLGNVIAPQKVSETLGAEIIRLWVASSDFSGELSISDEILKRVVESYRRIRNTLRFLLANTADFDPAKHLLPPSEWLEIDRYALAMTREMQMACIMDYAKFDFHLVAQRLQTFCSEDLGAFYLDILKDRLYTTAPKSLARRSAQTALWNITHAMLRWMAPFLSFTAEEAWKLFGDSESIFFETYAELGAPDAGLIEKWTLIRAARELVNKEIESLREAGKVGSSLQANVTLTVPMATHGELWSALASLQEDLKFVFITSVMGLAAGDTMAVKVTASEAVKCERCWHWRDDVGVDPAHPTICGRCTSNLFGAGEDRKFA